MSSHAEMDLQQLRLRLQMGKGNESQPKKSERAASERMQVVERRVRMNLDDLKRMKAVLLGTGVAAPTQRTASDIKPADGGPSTSATGIVASPLGGNKSVTRTDDESGDDDNQRRMRVLASWIQDLRKECASLTQTLVDAYPAGHFAEFFVTTADGSSQTPATASLPPPPPVEVMIDRFHAQGNKARQLELEEAARHDVESTIAHLRRHAQMNLKKIANQLVVEPPNPALLPTQRIPQNPIDVYGIRSSVVTRKPPVGGGEEQRGFPLGPIGPQNPARVDQFVKEVHAFQLLSFIMQAASTYDDEVRARGSHPTASSRGSSETPSITPITSVADQSVLLGGHDHGPIPGHGHASAAGFVSASTILHAQHVQHRSSTSERPRATQAVAASTTGVSLFSPNQSHAALGSSNAPQYHPASRGVQFAADTTAATDTSRQSKATTAVGGGREAERAVVAEPPSSASGASASTVTDATSSRQKAAASSSPTSSPSQMHATSTVHDTSTAATAGGAATSDASSVSAVAAAGGSSSSRQVLTTRSGWSDPANAAATENQQDRSSSSTASKKKKKRSFFSCIRRADDDDDDDDGDTAGTAVVQDVTGGGNTATSP